MFSLTVIDDENAKKRKRRRSYVTDEEDNRAMDEMISWSSKRWGSDNDERNARDSVDATPDNKDRRIRKLRLQEWKGLSLPDHIKRLTNLLDLNLDFSVNLEFIPPSIGQLKNLKYLHLRFTVQLVELPNEIGDLCSLKKLDLHMSGIESLPPSIGKMKHLEVLDLMFTKNLKEVPNEIGDLVSLKTIFLRDSFVLADKKQLPDSIGRLQNLEILNLGHYDRQLHNPVIEPELIWNLSNLKYLCLDGSGMVLNPEGLGKLTNLMYLHVNLYLIPYRYQRPVNFFLELANSCHSLGSICLGVMKRFSCTIEEAGEVGIALACNRARNRTLRVPTSGEKVFMERISPTLWPHVLANPTLAFAEYPEPYFSGKCWKVIGLKSKACAMYQLLAHTNKESFINLLLDRKNR